MGYIYLLNTTANITNGTNVMSDELIGAIITTFVTGIISIIGFIITNVSLKKSFKNELKRQRDSIALDKMSTMPYEVLILMDELLENPKNPSFKHFKEVMNTIYSYGSEKAIKIVSLMQKENYAANGNVNQLNKFRVIASYVLLATQIKYDVTEIPVSPELWFQMRISDYELNKSKFKDATNHLVDELDLISEFKIK